MIITVFDVETTGLLPDSDRIIEFGSVSFDYDGKEVYEFGSIIRPRRNSCYVPYEAYKIHGISEEFIEEHGKLWSDVSVNIHKIFSRSDALCAFNKDFDISFIKNGLKGVDLEFPNKPCIDPLSMAQRFIPYSTSPKKNLAALCRMFDINLSDAHRAVYDSRATGQLLFKMLKELDIKIDDMVDNKVKMFGKYHTSVKHFDPLEALYSGLPKKSIK